MKQVVSTMCAGQQYAEWLGCEMRRSVQIKGHGKSDSTMWGGGVPAAPAITEVSDEDAEFLAAHKQFQEHQERGFVKIINIDPDPAVVTVLT